jgi:predicted  nucleic acid-binding Zn-ribbon protein
MAKKRYTVKTGCPQCGCSRSQVLSEEEMKERYGHVPNFDMECGECMEKFSAEMKSACPEWDQECRMQD